MRRLLLVLAACGPPPQPAPISHHVAPPTAAPQIFRQLGAGKVRRDARRTTFALTSDGDRATIVETDEVTGAGGTIEQLDHSASWSVTGTRTYHGTRHGADLDLTTDDMQPLHLSCMTQLVDVAAPRARRVRSPNTGGDCGDRGVWDPPATRKIMALVCGAAGLPSGDDDDDDRFVFAPAPGIEWAFENDDCIIQGGGLRQIP